MDRIFASSVLNSVAKIARINYVSRNWRSISHSNASANSRQVDADSRSKSTPSTIQIRLRRWKNNSSQLLRNKFRIWQREKFPLTNWSNSSLKCASKIWCKLVCFTKTKSPKLWRCQSCPRTFRLSKIRLSKYLLSKNGSERSFSHGWISQSAKDVTLISSRRDMVSKHPQMKIGNITLHKSKAIDVQAAGVSQGSWDTITLLSSLKRGLEDAESGQTALRQSV